MSGSPERHISVISSDMWLDRPHGASVIKMFERLAEARGWDIDLFISSVEEAEERRNSLRIHGLKVPNNLKESSGSYYLYVTGKSFKLMRRTTGTIIFGYP